MTTVKIIQGQLAANTDAELLLMGHAVRKADTTADRIVSAAITEELMERNPQVMDAVTAWSEDLDTDAELIDVIAKVLAN